MAYRRALSLDPNVADSYLQLRHILKLQSKDAKAAYLRALALEPSVTFGLDELRALGWSAAETAELVAALRAPCGTARRACRALPGTGDTHRPDRVIHRPPEARCGKRVFPPSSLTKRSCSRAFTD